MLTLLRAPSFIILDLDTKENLRFEIYDMLEEHIEIWEAIVITGPDTNFDADKDYILQKYSPQFDKFKFCDDYFDFHLEPSSIRLNHIKQIHHPRAFETLYITQDLPSIEIAQKFNFDGILVANKLSLDDMKCGAELLIPKWGDLPKIFKGELCGYLGELRILINDIPSLKKRVLRGTLHQISNPQLPNCPVYIAGRHFRKEDPRRQTHLYSARLLDAKMHPYNQADKFSHTIDSLLNKIKKDHKLTELIITTIPPRPDGENRLEIMLEALDREKWCVFQCLRCLKDYKKQKIIPTLAGKEKNVAGVFTALEDVDITNKNIVLIDDILTSCSTLNEGARTLLKAGASKVILLGLGITVHTQTESSISKLVCRECYSEMSIRFNGQNGSAFWGCPTRTEDGWHQTVSIEEGFRLINDPES